MQEKKHQKLSRKHLSNCPPIREYLRHWERFYDSQDDRSAESLIFFLSDESWIKKLSHYARFSPHSHEHLSFEDDRKAAVEALVSWREGKVSLDVVRRFIDDLHFWLVGDGE